MGANETKEVSGRVGSVDYKSAPIVSQPRGEEATSDGVKIERETIDFDLGNRTAHGANVPLNAALFDSLNIQNNNDYPVKFKFEPCFPREFQLTFTPMAATIKPHSVKKVKAKLIIRHKVNVNYRVALNVEGAGSHFIVAKIRCETGVFGVDPTGLDFEDDGPYHVPSVLVRLKQALIQNGGLEQEGIFRLAGEQTLLKAVKQKMNQGDMTMPNEPNALATLIKIWFRELPQPLLNVLQPERIFYSAEIADCMESVSTLPPLQRALLDWLCDLLLMIAENRKTTKMTAQNLAIVVAPNLYEATTPDPMEGLVMSQKAVQFIHNVLVNRVRERERTTGRQLDTELRADELRPQPVVRHPTVVDKTIQTEAAAAVAAVDSKAPADAAAGTSGSTAAAVAGNAPDESPATSSKGGKRKHRHHGHHEHGKHRSHRQRGESSGTPPDSKAPANP